jgi:hypothetical protein
MNALRDTRLTTLSLSFLAAFFLVACNQSQPPAAPVPEKAASAQAKDVYLVFEGPWAFTPDPKDPGFVIALAPKTKRHRDLIVQSGQHKLYPGVYDLTLPPRNGSAAGEVDTNILRVKIDPQSVQHALETKSDRYVIRLPKPDAYVAATHFRSRAGSAYPPDSSTEKDYVTAVSLRYSVTSLNGFSLMGSPDSGTYNPSLLQVETPLLNVVIDPIAEPSLSDRCHTHERETFSSLTKLLNVTLFVDFPNDPESCHAKDPQNPKPTKSGIAPKVRWFFARGFPASGSRQSMAVIYFFGGHILDCLAPVIVASD